MNSPFYLEKKGLRSILVFLVLYLTNSIVYAQDDSHAVMEVVELEFIAQENYDNPYIDVDVWIELYASTSKSTVIRIPVFWDGENVYRARLVAPYAGNWSWKIIDSTVNNLDQGFIGRTGTFTAVSGDVEKNANNRGFIKVSANNRTLEYGDGSPFFYTADTCWPALTAVFEFDDANDITGISFKDYILARKSQGFNGLNLIASFPDDTYLEQQGRNLDRPNSKTGLWSKKTWGKKIGSNGATPFEMKENGQSVTDAVLEVDYRKINPKYWKSVDERMQFLADQGFVALFEAVRRHERWPFRTQVEKDAYYNYIRYLWARYGCYNMIFSWVHHDTNSGNVYPGWLEMVKHANSKLNDRIGGYRMPFGQPRTAMSFNSSLNNWEKDVPAALDLKNVSNSERDEDMHKWLRDIYLSPNPKPALNLEPFYPGWTLSSGNEIEPGLNDVSMAQMQMYGSVLSGGLAGHAWGDAWYAGAASSTNRPNGATNVPADDPKINAISAFESQAMGHLKSFILDSGHEYRRLIPAADTNLSDSKKFLHTLSISEDKSFALGFFTATTSPNPDPLPELTNLIPLENYLFEWWDITNGSWIREGYIVASDSGQLVLPSLPNDNDRSISWAYRIRSKKYVDEVEVTIDEPVEEPVIPADPINTGPIVPDPIDPDPIIPDVIDPNPIDADPVVQDPIETDPINPDPIDADPVNEPSEDANNDDLVSDEPDVTVDPVDEPEAEPIDPSPVSDAPVDENNDNSGDPDPVSEPISSPNSENIIAYPNATTDSFWITGLSAGAKEIKVMDLSGQLLIQERIDGNEPTLDLSNYPTGVYIVEVVQKGLKKTIKVVKE